VEPRRDTVETGARLGRFTLGAAIGSGAMGTVYTAVDPDLGRTVAIKVLHDVHSRPRLLREAQAMARLSHPNVVPVHEIGSGEPLFIVMELVTGGTVRDWLREPRSIDAILDVFEQAGRGLAAAHDAGLVHRDFKPENILRGTDGRVRVVDFGLVASRGEGDDSDPIVVGDGSPLELALTHTGIRIGTPAYMAPEQHRGEPADARSDQFGFAVALYEALYGERPFAGSSYRAMVRNVYAGTVRAAPADSRVPEPIRASLLRALAIDPAARFPSLPALLDALAGSGSADAAAPPSELSANVVSSPRPRKGRTVALALGIAAVGVAVTAIAFATLGSSTQPTTTQGPTTTTSPTPPPTISAPAPTIPSSATEPTATGTHATPKETATVAPGPAAATRTQRAKPSTATSPAGSAAPTIDEAAARRRKQLELSE